MRAQEEFTIRHLFDLNTDKSEYSCGLFNGELVVSRSSASKGRRVLPADFEKVGAYSAFTRGADFSSWVDSRSIFPKRWQSVGPVSFSSEDSLAFFASQRNFGDARGPHVKLYSSRWDGERWASPVACDFVDRLSDFIHPFYVSSCNMLVFASNCNGGQGGMDIWYSIKTNEGWSQPINLGLGVNSAANEICPSFYKGDIYYATNAADTWGGYDIRRAIGVNQWKTSIAEGAPINSAADDVGIFHLSEEKAVLTSNRFGGKGGTDLFLITRQARPDEMHQLQASVYCQGIALAGARLLVRNGSGEVVQQVASNELGSIDIRNLRLNQTYTFYLESGNSECMLVLKDEFGNRLSEIRFDEKGMAMLELLPFQYSDIRSLRVSDESLLNLSLEGQLYHQSPGDMGRGEPITILNSAGEPVALAYTNESGRFRFTKLDPQLRYVMRLSDQSEAKHAIITDRGRKIDIPILNAELEYTRLKKDEAIELVNEFNDTILISPHDLFVINRMYYAYNSAGLTEESRTQLDQLAIIMERNREVNLQLIAHTDSRGDDASNLDLSQRRASAAKEYLITKGISELRLNSRGLGEEQLMNECKDGVVCTEPEHAINRRTEIRLTLQNREILSGR
jgi:outer membrane protein OmpA-like peptidoglycan-associated protein